MRPGLAVVVLATLSACAGPVAEPLQSRVEALRPSTPDGGEAPPRFDPDEVVERHLSDGGRVAVHFSRRGRNAVSTRDDNGDGVPDAVTETARVYDDVLVHQRDVLGYRLPPDDRDVPVDNGGDARFDVYLLDFAGRADGAFRRERCVPAAAPTACTGYMLQENDFVGYRYRSFSEGVRTLASHEFFHAVQAGYNPSAGVTLGEGTAVWATHQFDPTLDDLPRLARGYLSAPDRSLDAEPTGPVDAFSYGTGLFFLHLSARFGPALVRHLWEASPDARWLVTLDERLRDTHGQRFADTFVDFCQRNLFTGRYADPTRGWPAALALPSLRIEALTAPVSVSRVRMFYASSRAWRIDPAGRPTLSLALRPAEDSTTPPLDALRLRVAVEHEGTLGPLSPVERGAVTTVALAPGDALVGLLVNPLTEGGSRQPGLCAGTPEEVAQCLGTGSDAGLAPTDAPEAPPATPAPSGGCTTAPHRPDGRVAPWILLGLAALAACLRRRRPIALCASGLALVAMTRSADAQTAPAADPDAADVQTVVVTGTRTETRLARSPVATEVLSRRDIEASGAENLATLLEEHTGMDVSRSNINGSTLRIQGLDPQYVLILVDGERTGGRINGGIDLTRFNLENVERVEIVRGPSSALYGADALGGVVNIITRPARNPEEAEARVRYGSLHTVDASGRAALRRGRWTGAFTAGFHRRDAFDRDPRDPGTTGSNQNALAFSLRNTWEATDRLQLVQTAEYFQRRAQGVDLGAGGAVFDRQNLTESFSVSLSALARLGRTRRTRLRTTAWYTYFRDQSLRDQRGANVLDAYNETVNHIAQLSLQADHAYTVRHTLTVGAEGFVEQLAADRLASGTGTRTRGSVYVQHQWTVLERPRLVLVPGARLDLDAQFGVAPTPKLQVRLDAHRTLILRASYGWGFRAPSFQELLLSFSNSSAGYVVEGNLNLRPERSQAFNLGATWQPHTRFELTVNLYRNDIDDLINTVLVGATGGESSRYTYRNVDRAWTMGVEAAARLRVATGLVLDLGYTLTATRDLTNQRPLEGRALHRANATVTWRHAGSGVELSTRLMVVGSRPFYETTGDVMAPPYASWDLRAAKRFGRHTSVFVGCDNALDAGDALRLLIPPRIVYAGLGLRY